MPLAAIIFDFDGVLANSEPLHYRAFRDELAARGFALSENDYYAKYLGYDDAGAFAALARDHGIFWSGAELAAMVAAKAQRMEELERNISILFPGAADAVRRARDVVPIGIASGALTGEIRRVLDREGLTQYFTVIVGADDTTASKPAPDPYLRAVALLGSQLHRSLLPGDCVAVEDSHWGLESARQAGLRTVGVAQTYPAEALAAADLVIDVIDRLDILAIQRLLST